jgi:hypothetical protein
MSEEETQAAEQSNREVVPSDVSKADGTNKNDTPVAYETHRRLLDQKKQLQERLQKTAAELDQFKAGVEQKQQKELEEQNRYKELYEKIRQDNESLQKAISERDMQMQNAIKYDAFQKSLGDRKIDRKYSGFVNTDNILLDPETGTVDELSAQKEVERILNEYPEIVRSNSSKALPSQAPMGVSSVKPATMQDRMAIIAKHLEAKRRG